MYVYADDAQASEHFTALTSQAARVCMGKSLGEGLAEEVEGKAEIGKVTTSQLAVDPVGEDSAAGRMTIPISDPDTGVGADVNIELIVVRQDRAISLVTLAESYSTFDDDLREELVSTSARRLKSSE